VSIASAAALARVRSRLALSLARVDDPRVIEHVEHDALSRFVVPHRMTRDASSTAVL
jgi:hypothetical protein|tara:strand:+ start:1150 stop:1320 length:171 start_codon:yes stop_codon:yes gene_type:complete